jgi:GT2 family glycosyltransferase
MKIVFVILHYLTVADTMACVDSILTQVTAGPASACEIVIVDNASPDGSGDQLARCYAGQKPVHLLRAPENLGFARGHNLGYQFAKNNLRADYIILLNNDTRISQPDFISKLEQIARATPFDVLGPDICTDRKSVV